jgi:hypothetical protein
MHLLGPLVLLVVVGAVVYKLLMRGRDDAVFQVEVRGPGVGGLALRGRVPGRSDADVLDFVAGLGLARGAKLWGSVDRGRLVVRATGDVPPELQQRLRNHLYN